MERQMLLKTIREVTDLVTSPSWQRVLDRTFREAVIDRFCDLWWDDTTSDLDADSDVVVELLKPSLLETDDSHDPWLTATLSQDKSGDWSWTVCVGDRLAVTRAGHPSRESAEGTLRDGLPYILDYAVNSFLLP